MHGQHSEDKQEHKWHMWPTQSHSTQLKNFSKGGRKFIIGDCALFQAGNAPPFIGIIRNLVTDKDGNLNLSVNWLYRPDELKLGKGALIDATPNEIFYSFHKDEISSTYLLHPCKVAFLRKGIELPPRLSCFVCRRVYDTTNKCLYWLTDQDYTDEHQVEVDQLLNRTKHEMQTSTHSPRTSQRSLSTPTSSKGGDVGNIAPPNNQHMRSKKRDRSDQSLDSGKREKLIKAEDTDSKRESIMRFEDFAEKGKGINSTSFAEQLVEMMIQEQSEGGSSKITNVIAHRILLASIISSTEKEDCLNHLVHLGSIPILDDWLQEAHKGKLGDGSPKESDRVLEELLLTLLCALEKLPVDLDALKTCMVGKSVRNLKSHKNTEIQKKARKLVDTWKKRVDEEMKSSDEGKSGLNNTATTTWSSSRPSNETQNMKGSSAKNVKLSPNGCDSSGDTKCYVSSQLETAMPKDNSVKSNSNVSGTNDTMKEEKSSSSSQSHNNSQSWCSGPLKGNGSLKEEGKTPSVTSKGNKSSGATLRSHAQTHSTKSHNTSFSTGLHRETTGRQKASTNEKSGSSLVDKGTLEGNRGEVSSIQRLIVRLPNPARSPAPTVSASSLIDGSVANNRGSSPVSTDKHDSLNVSSRAPVHSPDTSGDAKCSNSNNTDGVGKRNIDCKEEIDRSDTPKLDDAYCKSSDVEEAREKDSSDARLISLEKEPAASDIAANPSPSLSLERQAVDTPEGVIDLPANIATCDGSDPEKSSVRGENFPQHADISMESNIQTRISTDPDGKNTEQNDGDNAKKESPMIVSSGSLTMSERESNPQQDAEISADPPGETNIEGLGKDKELGSPREKDMNDPISSGPGLKHKPDVLMREADNEEEENMPILSTNTVDINSSMSVLRTSTFNSDAYLGKFSDGARAMPSILNTLAAESLARIEDGSTTSEQSEEDALEVARQVAKEIEQEVEELNKSEVHDAISTSLSNDELKTENSAAKFMESSLTVHDGSNAGVKDMGTERPITDESHAIADAMDIETPGEKREIDIHKISTTSEREVRESSSNLDHKENMRADLESVPDCGTDNMEDKGVCDRDVSAVVLESTGPVTPELPAVDDIAPLSTGKKLCRNDMERPIFDLNEGFAAEEVLHENEDVSSSCPAIISSDPILETSHQTGSIAAPVAILSASKGAFIPPSNLVRTNGEQGWKGSAATSAFRPAEPRRVAETLQPSLEANTILAKADFVASGKQARFLDIDLNVADERVMIEDSTSLALEPAHNLPLGSMNENPNANNGASPLRPELDLNRLDESDDNVGPQASVSRHVPPETSSSVSRVILNFDLNDGPEVEQALVEESPHQHKNVESNNNPVLIGGIRPNPDLVSMSPWYSHSSSSVPATMMIPGFSANRMDMAYPVLAATPSRRELAYPVLAATSNRRELAYPVLAAAPNRTELAYPVLATPSTKPMLNSNQNLGPFSNDLYQGGNSSGVPYSTTVSPPFSYAGFPFGAGFPFTSGSYNMSSNPQMSSANTNSHPFPMGGPQQLLNPGGVVSPYARPYLISSVGEAQQISDSNAAWARSNLDLNAGPDAGYINTDARDDGHNTRVSSGIPQLSYQQGASSSSTVIKRKEPETGFDQYSRSGFKQMTWQ